MGRATGKGYWWVAILRPIPIPGGPWGPNPRGLTNPCICLTVPACHKRSTELNTLHVQHGANHLSYTMGPTTQSLWNGLNTLTVEPYQQTVQSVQSLQPSQCSVRGPVRDFHLSAYYRSGSVMRHARSVCVVKTDFPNHISARAGVVHFISSFFFGNM
jgi:hypothetical protein